MVALIQRVRHASVEADGAVEGSIRTGLLIFLGVHCDDSEEEAAWIARKCANLRVFPDEDDKMNLSLTDIGGEALVISQFTLYGDVRRGNRPSFASAAPPEIAERLYEKFVALLEGHLEATVQTGKFGAMMDITLLNDGPVTLWVERMKDASSGDQG